MQTQNDGWRSVVRRVVLVCFMSGLCLLGLSLFSRMTQGKATKIPRREKNQAPTLNKNNEPKPQTETKLPEQKLGDTPVAPWEMPTPEEKAKARPARNVLEKALAEVDSPQKAAEVAEQLISRASDQSADEIKHAGETKKVGQTTDALVESAKAVKQAVATAAPGEKAASVIAQTAEEIAVREGRDREALAQAAQEVLNPEQQGVRADNSSRNREFLRHAFIERMRPLDGLDAELFLAINHLPHNRRLNGFFYFITTIFRAGLAWFGLMGLVLLLDRRQGWRVTRQAALPLTVATALVEYPIKRFFRRRRPFIGLIQAIVIGRKPGTWSFPSGHSAAAFAGAWLLGGQFPGWRWLFYSLAALVGFSRIYLGDHYPGDVLSGALSGIVLAEGTQRLQQAVGGEVTGR